MNKLQHHARWLGRLGIFVAIAGAAFFVTIILIIGRRDTLDMPDLSGRELMEALELLNQRGIDARVERMEFSDRFDKGQVMAQRPPAGRAIRKGRTALLTVSRGLRKMSMVDLVGMDEALALQVLRNNGMSVRRRLLSCVDAGAADELSGRVIAQHPQALDNVERENGIELVVSSGRCAQEVFLPDFRGQTLDAVLRHLKDYGVSFFVEESEASSKGGAAVVLEQEPQSSLINIGDTLVRLRVPHGGLTPQRRLSLRYLRWRLPYGFTKMDVRLRTYLPQTLSASDVDFQASPGKNVEWILPIAEGLSPEIFLNGEKQVLAPRFGGNR